MSSPPAVTLKRQSKKCCNKHGGAVAADICRSTCVGKAVQPMSFTQVDLKFPGVGKPSRTVINSEANSPLSQLMLIFLFKCFSIYIVLWLHLR